MVAYTRAVRDAGLLAAAAQLTPTDSATTVEVRAAQTGQPWLAVLN